MDFIFLHESNFNSLIPILTLIEKKSELVVGCILLGAEGTEEEEEEMRPPEWFTDAACSSKPASDLLRHVQNRHILKHLEVFLVVKEPNSLLQLTVLVAIGACNLNHSGAGGRDGKKILEYLEKYNIPTYPAEVMYPSQSGTKKENQEAMKETFLYAFSDIADKWLPRSWGVEPTTC